MSGLKDTDGELIVQPPESAPPRGTLPNLVVPIALDPLELERVSRDRAAFKDEAAAVAAKFQCDKAALVTGAAALAARDRAIFMCLHFGNPDGTTEEGWLVGGIGVSALTYVVGDSKEAIEIRNPGILAERLGAISGKAEALGRVLLSFVETWVPISDGEMRDARRLAEFYGWRPFGTETAGIEVEERSSGYVVRVPTFDRYGCTHPLIRSAFFVAHDGRTCRLREPSVPLAASLAPVCVD